MIKRSTLVLLIFIFAFSLIVEAEEQLKPRKVEVDSNYDGTIDRVEYYSVNGEISRVESDTDLNGIYDEWIYYKSGKVEKAEKDTNGDGKPDTWIEY